MDLRLTCVGCEESPWWKWTLLVCLFLRFLCHSIVSKIAVNPKLAMLIHWRYCRFWMTEASLLASHFLTNSYQKWKRRHNSIQYRIDTKVWKKSDLTKKPYITYPCYPFHYFEKFSFPEKQNHMDLSEEWKIMWKALEYIWQEH